jgi:predicted nuclease of predicted toxin-antitoxin system
MVRMLVLVDVNVPQPVARYLADRGHDVRLSRDLVGAQATDAAIVAAALAMQAVVLTMDKDYTRLAQKALTSGLSHKRSWGLILLRCREPQALPRIQQMIEAIEFEYEQSCALHPDCLLVHIEIHDHHVVVRR